MKKRAFLLPLILALLTLTISAGCSNTKKEDIPDEITESISEYILEQTKGTEAETSAITEDTPLSETVSDYENKKSYSFNNIYLSDMFNTNIKFDNDNPRLKEYGKKLNLSLSRNFVQYYSFDTINILTEPLVRDSSGKIAITEAEKAEFASALEQKDYIPLYTAEKGYSFDPPNGLLLSVKEIEKKRDEFYLTADNISCSYSLHGNITVNAFVTRDEDNSVYLIVDPAYMIGLPLFGKNPDEYIFNINGNEIMMDTIKLSAGQSSSLFPVFFESEGRGDDFFYAAVELESISVEYDFAEGYSTSCYIKKITHISDDISEVISIPFSSQREKSPKMTETYDALINGYETLCKDSTRGIVLLDMDFDGKAEVLVSDVDIIGNPEDFNPEMKSEVSVYRVENGLKYIGSFPCDNRLVYSTSLFLGLKELPDGTKGWFATHNGDGYIYKLMGDKLERTEVFSQKAADPSNPDGEQLYYFMGKEIIPTVIHEEETVEDWESDTHLEWNGSYSYFGEMWELYGHIREDYCRDITESYALWSDWLTDDSLLGQIPHNPREYSYTMAYLTDSFYLGNYNPASRRFEYRFLGDYAKPVIYLYPEEETKVEIKVDFPKGGGITCSYPDYQDGWTVTALPDGTLYDGEGNEYYCLYWEGKGDMNLNGEKGWCVKGKDTANFLRAKLTEIGLTAKEANEFIIYWLPLMECNRYNIISFHIEDYIESVPLEVTPKPHTAIRVFMTFKGTEEFVDIKGQELKRFERNGFTLVEWGGSRVG